MSKNYFITGLDVGTSETKVLVTEKKSGQNELEIISQVSVPSNGVRKGIIVNVDEASKSIMHAMKEAQEIARQRIKNVYCSVGGSHIFVVSGQGRVAVSRADETVSKEDIDRAVSAATAFSLPANKEIIDVMPKDFVLDGEGGIKDVEGMKGIRLEANVLLLGGFTPYIKNFTQAVLNSNLGFDDRFLSPIAVARAVLNPRQKELGVAVVDIGAGTTSLAVFEEGNLIHMSVLPVGSANITNDIAIGLRTDIDIAEKIKLEYATATPENSWRREAIDFSENAGEELIFSKKELYNIVESRLSQIFDSINKELKLIFKERLLPAGVILTGGGSKLPKLKDFVRDELKLPVRLGTINGFGEPLEDHCFSVCAGLVLLAQDPLREGTPVANGDGEGALAWLKKLLQSFKP